MLVVLRAANMPVSDEPKGASYHECQSQRKVTKTMQHKQVIENFINQGTEGSGMYVKADKGILISKIPALYSPGGWKRWEGRTTPLAARLDEET